MTTIGFIGSGNIGSTVAHLAVEAGDDVVVSNSRGPETLADLVADLGPHARAATADEAAAAGDLVVVSIPFGRIAEVPTAPLAGKVVLDTGNYYPDRDGRIAALDDATTTTSTLLQEHLRASHVVKVFNNIFFRHLRTLARPSGAADRSSLLIAGDDVQAKRTATAFLDTIGYDVLDTGSLADSWRFERDQPAYARAYAADPDHPFEAPRRTTPADLEPLLAAATRTPPTA